MMNELLISSLVIFAYGVCYLAYTSRFPAYLKLMMLPLAGVIVLSSLAIYYESLGKPNPYGMPERSEYIHHRITNDDTIVVWLLTEEKGDRLYVIPYTRESAQELEEAKEQKEGQQVQVDVTTEIDEEGRVILSRGRHEDHFAEQNPK